MRTPESWLKQIQKLREKSTAHFKAKEWDQMQATGRKIITAWAGYHEAVRQGSEDHPSFNTWMLKRSHPPSNDAQN